MRDIPFVECIAQRALVLERPDGSTTPVTLEIGRPVPVPRYNIPFACPYRLVSLDRAWMSHVVGVDEAQVLQLAFRVLAPVSPGTLAIPSALLLHRAVLSCDDGQPFSVLIETYTD